MIVARIVQFVKIVQLVQLYYYGYIKFFGVFTGTWDGRLHDNHMSPHIHPLKTKVKKPKTKGIKADSVEKVTIALALAGDGTPVVTSRREQKSVSVNAKRRFMKDNPRLFNNPPRNSKEWKLEYNVRTSAERSNKRGKLDFKLEDGRQRSTKMWYCRLYHILMLQHLDAWDLPSESPLKKLILDVA